MSKHLEIIKDFKKLMEKYIGIGNETIKSDIYETNFNRKITETMKEVLELRMKIEERFFTCDEEWMKKRL